MKNFGFIASNKPISSQFSALYECCPVPCIICCKALGTIEIKFDTRLNLDSRFTFFWGLDISLRIWWRSDMYFSRCFDLIMIQSNIL